MPEQSVEDKILENIYKAMKKNVIRNGFEKDIEWYNNIPPIDKLDKNYFYQEYSWVVINSGMKNDIAKKIYNSFLTKNGNNFKINFQAVKHPSKCKALRAVWSDLDKIFEKYKKSYNKLMFLESLPHIGPITKYHLAKNLGLDCAKPDRHLVRIASFFGYLSVQTLCKQVSDLTGDKISVVDTVFWRYATLNPNYIDLINNYKKEMSTNNVF